MNSKKSNSILILSVLTSGFLLFGCGPSVSTATDSSEILPSTEISETGIASPTNPPATTDTPAPSSTPTLTPTITETPTIEPSPTPNLVMPGNYYVGECTEANGQYGATITFCVTGVRVTNERHMFFDVSWKITDIPADVTVTKQSDKGNQKMYLTDNFGNFYPHITGGGGAYRDKLMINDYPVSGWFEFGSAPVGALKFDFHDDNNHMVIKDIVLIPGLGYIQYDTLILDQYPLIVRYDEDKWNPTKSGDNTNMLTHKTMPSCTIQPRQPSEPGGKFKSLTAVGEIDYKIYGYFDDSQNLYVREYVYDSGLIGLDPGIKPFFYVTIPEDKTLDCIVAVNNVLSRLALPEP
jgi:hypothetical protein